MRFEMTYVQRFGYGLHLFEILKFQKFFAVFDIGAYRFKREILPYMCKQVGRGFLWPCNKSGIGLNVLK